MQKYLKILERNVQWIAIGLGALYMFWMAYAYVLTPPVVVQLGNSPSDKKVTPDEVDDVIMETAGKPLQTAMTRTEPVDIKVADVLAPFLDKIDQKNVQLADIKAPLSGTRGSKVSDTVGPDGPVGPVTVAKVPQLPPAQFVAESDDISTIILPNPNAAPVIPLVNPGGVQALPPHKDTAWYSGKFKIPFQALQQAWGTAFNNPNVQGFQQLFQTKLLRIDVMREELLPDGKWGNPTPIEIVHDAPPYPKSPIDLNDQASRQAAGLYRDWAGKAQPDLLNPKFPEVLSVMYPWYPPGQQRPDPKKIRPANNGNRMPRPNVAPAPNNGAAGPAGWGAPTPAVPAGQNPGDFDVAKLANDLEILFHDTTVESGRKYRYRLVYELANPVFDSMNITTRELASQLALVSPSSDPTPEVDVPPMTRLWVTNVSAQTNKASLEVFEWKDAKWNPSKVTVSPGDSVKGFTVVDIRRDTASRNGESYMLLVDPNGSLMRKDKNTDMRDPKYDELKNAVAAEQQIGGPRFQASAR